MARGQNLRALNRFFIHVTPFFSFLLWHGYCDYHWRKKTDKFTK